MYFLFSVAGLLLSDRKQPSEKPSGRQLENNFSLGLRYVLFLYKYMIVNFPISGFGVEMFPTLGFGVGMYF